MGWVSIHDELPPNNGSYIYEYDGVYPIRLNYSSVTLSHIHEDISLLGYPRVTHWAYKSTVEDSEGNVIEPGGEVGDKKVEKDTAENVKDTERTKSKADSWTSDNGKWTVEKSGELKGSLIDNKTGKIYLWNYQGNEVEVIGTKIPKYIDKKIREITHG